MTPLENVLRRLQAVSFKSALGALTHNILSKAVGQPLVDPYDAATFDVFPHERRMAIKELKRNIALSTPSTRDIIELAELIDLVDGLTLQSPEAFRQKHQVELEKEEQYLRDSIVEEVKKLSTSASNGDANFFALTLQIQKTISALNAKLEAIAEHQKNQAAKPKTQIEQLQEIVLSVKLPLPEKSRQEIIILLKKIRNEFDTQIASRLEMFNKKVMVHFGTHQQDEGMTMLLGKMDQMFLEICIRQTTQLISDLARVRCYEKGDNFDYNLFHIAAADGNDSVLKELLNLTQHLCEMGGKLRSRTPDVRAKHMSVVEAVDSFMNATTYGAVVSPLAVAATRAMSEQHVSLLLKTYVGNTDCRLPDYSQQDYDAKLLQTLITKYSELKVQDDPSAWKLQRVIQGFITIRSDLLTRVVDEKTAKQLIEDLNLTKDLISTQPVATSSALGSSLSRGLSPNNHAPNHGPASAADIKHDVTEDSRQTHPALGASSQTRNQEMLGKTLRSLR